MREADGGILFLDGIAELGLDEQAMLLRAIEEKRIFPLGADREASRDFQLIAGTHRDMRQGVSEGRFREDLYARINMWTFRLLGLAERREDIEPNVDYELQRFMSSQQSQMRFDKDARTRYLRFACSGDAAWRGNFRELGASVARMATLVNNARITVPLVDEEIGRMRVSWHPEERPALALPIEQEVDLFDKQQLEMVIQVCQHSTSLSEAGRNIFAISRQQKKQPNGEDRLRKYLMRFDLSWEAIQPMKG